MYSPNLEHYIEQYNSIALHTQQYQYRQIIWQLLTSPYNTEGVFYPWINRITCYVD